jgi:hypothetical protein
MYCVKVLCLTGAKVQCSCAIPTVAAFLCALELPSVPLICKLLKAILFYDLHLV